MNSLVRHPVALITIALATGLAAGVPSGLKQWVRRAQTMSNDASSPVPASFGIMATKSASTSPVGPTSMSFVIFVLAAPFSAKYRDSLALSEPLERQISNAHGGRPWAETRNTDPLTPPSGELLKYRKGLLIARA